MDPWAAAFLTALGITLLAIPLLRRLALLTAFVDRPDKRKSHSQPTPYLGGVALIGAVLLAILLQPDLPAEIGGLALGAALIGTMGLLDDDRNLDPGLRFFAETVAAIVAVALGLRIHATDLVGLDVVLTVVWIVGITNALNLLDNMDGLAGGVAAAAAFAVLWLAVVQGEDVTATVAAALAGACLGFLVYNRRPASVFMGDTGSLFLGFVLAVLTVNITPAVSQPASFAVPVLILSLPVLDTATVTLGRLRHRRPVSQGGKDHLSHRLVARGLSPGVAVLCLIGTQVLLGVLAVLAGLDVIGLRWAIAGAALVLLGVLAFTGRAAVYEEPVAGIPRRLRVAVLTVGLGLVVLAGPALVALTLAHGPAGAGSEHLTSALSAVGGPDDAYVIAELDRAAAEFERAQGWLRSPLASAGLVVPGLSSNVRAARTLTDTGRELARHAAATASLARAGRISVSPVVSPVGDLRQVQPLLEEASEIVSASQRRLNSAESRPYLVPALRRTTTRLSAELDTAEEKLAQAATLVRLLPTLLGTGDERRYLLALRDGGSPSPGGGPVGATAELVARDGTLSLDVPAGVPGIPETAWSSDFPTAAGQLRDNYLRQTGRAVDGVIAMDENALAALGRLAAANRLPTPDGNRVAADAVYALWQAALTRPLGNAARVGGVLGDAVRRGHLFAFLADAEEQALVTRLGADGGLASGNQDSLLVVNEAPPDGTGGPVRQQMSYDVEIEPGGRSSTLLGRLTLLLSNPPTPAGSPADPGRTTVSVFTPLAVRDATVDGAPTAVVPNEQLGRRGASVPVTVAPTGERTVRMDLAGTVRLGAGDWYRLEVTRPPGTVDDPLFVTIGVPRGWQITEAKGLALESPRRAAAGLDHQRQHDLWVRIERAGWSRFWHRLLHGSQPG